MQPKKWHEVYPYGTKKGDEEAKVFRALSRHHKYDYRSTSAIQQATGLGQEKIEEILDKYMNQFSPPLIYQHPTNEDYWGYWERCGLPKQDKRNLSQRDQDHRVDKHLSSSYGDDKDDCDKDCACDKFDDVGVTSNKVNNAANLKGSQLLSDFDILTQWFKYSEDAAQEMLARLKIQKLEELKL